MCYLFSVYSWRIACTVLLAVTLKCEVSQVKIENVDSHFWDYKFTRWPHFEYS